MPEIIMTCGTICCGKSTYAKKIQTERNAVILSILSAAAAGYSLFRMRSGPDRRPRMQCAERPLLLLREFRSRASSGLSRSPRSSGIRFSADDPGVPHRSIYRHPGGDQPAVLSSSRLIAPGMSPYSEICSLIGSFMQSLHRGFPIIRRKRSH